MDVKNMPGRFSTYILPAAFLAAMAVCTGCSGERTQDSLFGPAVRETVVVDAVLYVDRPLPQITVSRTLNADIEFSRAAAAVDDAEVTVYQGLAAYRYESAGRLGRYLPPPGAPRVRPGTEYRLQVRAMGREVLGRTTTPPRISLDEVNIIDEGTTEVIQRLSRQSAGSNRVASRQGIIEMRFDPIDVEAYQVVVLDRESNDVVHSPPLKAEDGTMRVPWFAIGPTGKHEVEIYALDRNLFDFVRTVESSGQNPFGFGSLAGDTFERPVFNLDGGIGVFGSASLDSFGFVVVPDR